MTDEDKEMPGQLIALGGPGRAITYSLAPGTPGTLKGHLSIDPDSGLFTYMPEADFYGEDAFYYVVSDGPLVSAPAKATITVNPVNDYPVAIGARVETKEDEPLTGDLVANDVDYDPLTFRTAKKPDHGKVTIVPNGPYDSKFLYTPNRDFNGEDSFTFIAKDEELDSNEAKVVVTVLPVNDTPVANPLVVSVPPNRTLIGQLPGVDVDLERLTYKMESQPSTGTVTVDKDSGRFTYLPPPAEFKGLVTFTYSVSDVIETSPPATVEIKVGSDSVGFIGDTLRPKITSTDFPTGAGSFDSLQFDLPGAAIPTVLDQCIDRANRRLYVLTAGGLEIFEILQRPGPPELKHSGSVAVTGTHLAISLDGRTAFVGGTGKVTAINLYQEGVYSVRTKSYKKVGESLEKPAYGNIRVYPFSPVRPVAAMGVHPGGDRLIVVIDALVKKLDIKNDLLLSDAPGAGIRGVIGESDLPADFGFLTELDISADAQTNGEERTPPLFAPPADLKDLIYTDRKVVALGLKSLAFSPDGNCLFISAVGAQTPRATPFGIMPTSDEGSGGIVVLDVRPRPADKPSFQYLGFIPTIVQNREYPERNEETDKMQREVRAAGMKIVHPQVQFARDMLQVAEAGLGLSLVTANRFTTMPSLLGYLVYSQVVAELEDSFKDYGNMQAYFNLYPRNMVGASSIAINHIGDFGIVALQDTNNLGLLSLGSSADPSGYSVFNRPDFYIKQGTGKSINGFGDAASGYYSTWAYSWAYPQKVVFTSDDSRIYIGMAGGTPKADNTNRFGSADAYKLHSERDLLKGFFTGGNPPPGYSLFGGGGGAAQKSPRVAAALQGFDSDHDLLSDQLEAYNRWNSLSGITWKNWMDYLVSTTRLNLTDPGKPAAMDNGIKDAFDRGYFVPPSGIGYRLNRYGMPSNTTNFATKGVVTALEQIGLEWDKRFHENANKSASAVVDPYPITRPYFVIGLLSQPGGGKTVSYYNTVDGLVKTDEALRYVEGTGSEVDFPYLSLGSDMPHDFVTTNEAPDLLDNTGETRTGFDLPNTEALIRLLLAQPRVTKIALDPYVADLIPDIKDDPRIEVHGKRPAPGSKDIPTERRDLDNHMFVTFGSMYVDMDVDSDNNGPIDGTPSEDQLEDQASTLGKFIPANVGDTDGDLIPNYADGYDRAPESNKPNAGGTFTPIAITFPEDLDLTKTQFRLIYSESNPAAVTRSPPPAPFTYAPDPSGAYRIWSEDGAKMRKMAALNSGGDFIKSNETYLVTDLGTHLVGRKVTVYIESVNPGISPAERDVVIEVIPNAGPESSVGRFADTVFVYSASGAMLVDANRDSKFSKASDDNSDFNSIGVPFRFWLNDDNDGGNTVGSDIPGQNETEIGTIIVDGISKVGRVPLANYHTDKTTEMGVVNGSRDLIDYFPVALDLKQMVSVLPPATPGVKYKLKQIDGALNVVFTSITREEAFLYQRRSLGNSFGPNLDQPAESAAKQHITANGVELSLLFLKQLSDGKRGVLLIDARRPTNRPLVLCVEKDGSTLAEIGLELSISGVEDMFSHRNLSSVAGEANLVGDRADSPNWPDALPDGTKLTNGKNLVFVHGYNVNQQQARGWASEIFKKLWWSGSRARFHAVTWRGSDTQTLKKVTINYHINVRHAFATASAFKLYIDEVAKTGEVISMAHSLGNMLVMSSIHDYNADISRHLAVDAAVAIEALDGDAPEDLPNMAHPYWTVYEKELWPTEWHKLFKNRLGDGRANLTWRNRLYKAVPKVWNFYSSGEDVLDNSENVVPWVVDILTDDIGRYAWALQEKLKGQLETGYALGSTYGGWGFNYQDWRLNASIRPSETDTQAMWDAPMRQLFTARPVFNKGNDELSFLYDPTLNERDTSYRVPDEFFGSGFHGYDSNRLLAEMFPSLTFCMGRNPVPAISSIDPRRNVDVNATAFKVNRWPLERNDRTESWHHSDSREVSYFYIFPVIDKLVEAGGLK